MTLILTRRNDNKTMICTFHAWQINSFKFPFGWWLRNYIFKLKFHSCSKGLQFPDLILCTTALDNGTEKSVHVKSIECGFHSNISSFMQTTTKWHPLVFGVGLGFEKRILCGLNLRPVRKKLIFPIFSQNITKEKKKQKASFLKQKLENKQK